MIHACVFDLDGTLLNSLKDIANSTNYALAHNGYQPCPVDQYRSFVGDGLEVLIRRVLGPNYTTEAGILLVNDFNFYYGSHYSEFTLPYNGVPELLQSLLAHGLKLAVLSNKPDGFVKVIIKELFPDTDFTVIQGKTDKFAHKPDPASLENVMRELGVKTGETLYIGDSDIDIHTAHNAKLKAVGVTWGFRERSELEAAGADYIVDSPEDILKLVYNIDRLGS
ncbi:MAG: HAD family hydrolase [Syntrophomonadaceae bacterium]|nr:HAD family hydrolase [Syntrophomonadaceae bacterium]